MLKGTFWENGRNTSQMLMMDSSMAQPPSTCLFFHPEESGPQLSLTPVSASREVRSRAHIAPSSIHEAMPPKGCGSARAMSIGPHSRASRRQEGGGYPIVMLGGRWSTGDHALGRMWGGWPAVSSRRP
jgi:hypothetical protein